jgi:hypothetical protein
MRLSTRTPMRSAALGLAAVGLALSQQAYATAAEAGTAAPAAAPAAGAPAAQATPAAAQPAWLNGERQVNLRVAGGTKVLSVGRTGRVIATTNAGDRALFVFVPAGDGRYQIHTGAIRHGGESDCLQVVTAGSNPLRVVTAACDAGNDGQLFDVRARRADNATYATFVVANRDALVQLGRNGSVIAEELGDGPVATWFTAVDRGEANLPVLGD